jgi:hypothetical protein
MKNEDPILGPASELGRRRRDSRARRRRFIAECEASQSAISGSVAAHLLDTGFEYARVYRRKTR